MPKTLYIVAGMHRSGTSLVARMLEVYGIRLPGDLVGPAEDNPTGFFEDARIVELNDQILAASGRRWDSLDGFFLDRSDFSHPKFNHLKKKARDLLAERIDLDVDWAFKDPRISRLGGFWLPLIEAAGIPCRIVLSVRDPAEVAGSLEKRNGFAHLKSLYLWTFHLLDILTQAESLPLIVARYDEVMISPDETVKALAPFFTDRETDAGRLREFADEFVSADLRHHQKLELDCDPGIAAELYGLLADGVPGKAAVAAMVTHLKEDAELQALLAFASANEIRLEQERAEQYEELTATIEEQRTRFEGYQSKLEADLAARTEWSEKQGQDIVALRKDAETLGQSIATGNRRISELESSLAKSEQDFADQHRRSEMLSGELDAKSQEVDRLQAEARQESMRLWAIVELYRTRVEEMEASHSWRVTEPLRWTRRMIQKAPGFIWRQFKSAIRWLVFLLPVDSMVRQWLVKVYERSVLFARGEVDSHALQASHRSMISARKDLLGERSILPVDELPDLDISVVTYNSSQWIGNFLESLHGQAYPLSKIHLFFVDNGSSDDTVAKLRALDWSLFGGFSLIESDNRGYGAGHNQGVGAGENSFVLVTNVDLEFRRESLVRALSFAVQDSDSVASWELRQAPFEHPKYYDPVSLQTPWSAHACILFRRDAFVEAGGYEEKIFMYGEDVELSYRLRSMGYQLRYLPAAIVNHYSYEEPGQVKLLQYQGSTLANAYLRMRYGSWFDVFRILPMYLSLLRGRAGVADSRAVVRGNIAKVLANAPYFLRQRKAGQSLPFRGWDYDIVRTGAFYECQDPGQEAPLVSIVTRSYQGRDALLKECLQSVAHQTYENIEHVIVEDGGNSLERTIDEFRAVYPSAKISYFPLPKGGRCETGNRGLEVSSGEYLMFLDDDDLLFSDHVEACVAELQADENLAAAYALAWEVETEFSDDHYEEKSHGTPDIQHQSFDRELLGEYNYIPIQSIVFRRERFEKHGGFDPELDNLEDWNLWIRYASDAEFKMIPKTTSMFRTPWDLEEKARRQRILDEYLPVARLKNAQVAS